MMPKISILMPAYNAEKYISEALESIRNQSYYDWETIIVDDCSSDATAEICSEYAKKDDRIKFYKNDDNCGISENKNRALLLASGKYIAFCDDDDVMQVDALKDNIRLIETYDADLVRWSYKTINMNEENLITSEIERKCRDKVYLNREEMFGDYDNIHELLSCDWTGLYRKSLLDEYHITFNVNYRYGGEDTDFNIQVLKYVNSVVMNSKVYYNWYLRKRHSTTAKRNINFCYTMMEVAESEYNLLCNNQKKEIWPAYAEFYKKLITDYAAGLYEDEKLKVLKKLKAEIWC